MKTYTILGTTDERTTCDLCGRDDLKSTVALQPFDGSEPVFFGSDCASKATGWTIKEITTSAKTADKARRDAENEAKFAAYAAETARWEEFLFLTTGQTDVATAIRSLGGYAAARAAYKG